MPRSPRSPSRRHSTPIRVRSCITALRNNKSDTRAIAALARRILRTLLTGAYRQNAGEWNEQEDESAVTADVLPPTLGRTEAHRPYFEVLIVTGVPATRWAALVTEWRRLRRPPDQFVYEPVFVGSFEDAFCATMLNPDLAAVVIQDGFPFRSRHDAPILRSLIEAAAEREGTDIGPLRLAQLLKRVRPELDLYMVSNGKVEEIAGMRRRKPCAGSSTRSRSCSSCILRSSRACRRATRRHSSTI